jgi:outer membrane protein assembly factor BamD (BamD/ComL family)
VRRVLFPLAILWLSGCAILGSPSSTQPEKEFHAAAVSVKAKRYQDAVVSYNKIIAANPGSALSADALFELALVHAHRDNPERDYTRATHAFENFLKRYPDDRRVREAQNWIFVLKQVLELKKENEHLKLNIEQLERLDIKHEERRRAK